MSFAFYLKTAFRNIFNGKKQSFLYILGIILSLSLLVSIRLWSSTAEDLAANDFLKDQDYELRVTSYRPDDIPYMVEWLSVQKPLVELTSEMFYNLACFNAENKPSNYVFLPEDQQTDPNDPLSLTGLMLFPKNSLDRIKSQFSVRGSFDIGLNECLVSEFEALELERIFGFPIEPGMQLNLSIARNGPELGQVLVHHLELKHFYNVTIKGIYRPIPQVSLLQKIFAGGFLRDSVIFLSENMNSDDIVQMKANGLDPIIMVKCNDEALKEDGIDNILIKLEDLVDRLKLTFQSSQSIILDTSIIELQQSYSIAQTAIVFVIPVVVVSFILTIFTENIVIEKRKEQITTLKDRGGQNWQIILIVLLELIILFLIGFLISIGVSFLLSGFIPTLASGSFSGEIFKLFILSSKFPYTLLLYTTLLMVLGSVIFAVIKMFIIFADKTMEAHNLSTIKRTQRIILAVVLTLLFLIISILLVIFAVRINNQIEGVYNFDINDIQNSMIVFLLITIILIVVSLLATVFLDNFLAGLKWLYKRLFLNNSFFVSNNLKKSKNKLTSLLLLLIIVSTFNVFSLNLFSTINRNTAEEAFYNNGADLRIHTTYMPSHYANNITQIEGIEEAMPILRADGKLIYNSVTVYGVDPIKYARIGRWSSAYPSLDEVINMMNTLNQTENGAIISDHVATRLNITLGSIITVTGLPNSTYIDTFSVAGIIHSAPGLGLAYGRNLELNQPNEEFLLINQYQLTRDYGVTDTGLFLASQEADYDTKLIISDLKDLSEVIDVNPELINSFFIGNYVSQYIPDVKKFLLIQIILMNAISFIILATNLEFIITQRDKNNAVLQVLGNSNKNLLRMLYSEILVIIFTSFIISLVFALPLSILSFSVNRPMFDNQNILPYIFSFDYLGISIFLFSLLVIALITIIPSVIRFSKKNVSVIIR
ncbi:MAG: ABC transporter permease [Asgard group archaeon]|nr:ABC transporter permease [Asgard group archaeon]